MWISEMFWEVGGSAAAHKYELNVAMCAVRAQGEQEDGTESGSWFSPHYKGGTPPRASKPDQDENGKRRFLLRAPDGEQA